MAHEEISGYLTFKGPAVNEGKMGAEETGRALLALAKLFDNFIKIQKREDLRKMIEFKVSEFKKGSTEIGVCLQELVPVVQPLAATGSALLIAETIGLRELGKSFFSTVGTQLGLKLFSGGKKLDEDSRKPENGAINVVVVNTQGEKRTVSQNDWEQYGPNQPYLRDLIQLDQGKAEDLHLGYLEKKRKVEVAHVNYQQRNSFVVDDEYLPARERFDEEFKEQDATPLTLVGKFMDYYGRAQKYHFSFQARKKQDEIGRHYILCIVPEDKIDEIIEYLKPSNKDNVSIYGLATKNHEGKFDKIKVQYISKDEDFNPDQVNLFDY